MIIPAFAKDCAAWVSGSPRQRQGVRALQVFIGTALLYRFFTEFPFANYLWGPSGVAGAGDHFFSHDWSPYIQMALLAAAAGCLLAGRHTRVATIVACFVHSLLSQRLPELLDGGDNLLNLILIYMCFLVPARASAKAGSVRAWLHNIAVAAVGLQIMVLYMSSGLAKASGAQWTQGTAMYLISQVEVFSLPLFRESFKSPLVTTTLCYVTILHQVWLPIAVFSRFRGIWIMAGVAFHAAIGVFMGLVSFSLVMIGAELFFLSQADCDRARLVGRRLREIWEARKRSAELGSITGGAL